MYCYSELLYRNIYLNHRVIYLPQLLYHVYVVYLFGLMRFKSNLNI